jgi:REP element-mobilizing transposase RayT
MVDKFFGQWYFIVLKQLSFLSKINVNFSREHGHEIRKGKRKLARPFSPKLPLHLVFRATQAKASYSLLTAKNRKLIERLLYRYASLYRIKIYRFQNVGNHLHVLAQTQQKNYTLARKDLNAFLRRFSGEAAMAIAHGKKGAAFGRFWDELVYSRIVTWGREFEAIKTYFIKNLFEAHGLWDRKRHSEWVLKTISTNTS